MPRKQPIRLITWISRYTGLTYDWAYALFIIVFGAVMIGLFTYIFGYI
jgi:hypothetical protein